MLYQANSCCLSAKACWLLELGFHTQRILHKALYFWAYELEKAHTHTEAQLDPGLGRRNKKSICSGSTWQVMLCCIAAVVAWSLGFKQGISGKGMRCAPQLKFLESEPKKCKPSSSCPLAHLDKAFIWFLESWCCLSTRPVQRQQACTIQGECRRDGLPRQNSPSICSFSVSILLSSLLFFWHAATVFFFHVPTRFDGWCNIFQTLLPGAVKIRTACLSAFCT